MKRAMHRLSSRDVTRKMLHRTPSETAYTSSSRYPKMAIFGQIKTRHPKNGRTSTLTVWAHILTRGEGGRGKHVVAVLALLDPGNRSSWLPLWPRSADPDFILTSGDLRI